MKSLIMSFTAIFLASAVHADEVDRSDPSAVAEAWIQAYKDRDLQGMSDVMTERRQKRIAEVVEQGEEHPAYDKVFSGRYFDALEGWTGSPVGEVRDRDGDGVLYPFAKDEGKVHAVHVVIEGDQWTYSDIDSFGIEAYEAFPVQSE